MNLRFLTPGIALSVLCFVACGQTSTSDDKDGGGGSTATSTPATSAAGKDAACADACALVAKCKPETDEKTCVSDCVKDESVSRAGAEVTAACLAKLSCDEVQSQQALACVLAGIQDVAPSAAGTKFCNDSLARFNECQATTPTDGLGGAPAATPTPDADTCLESISLASDELLTGLNGCAAPGKSCESLQYCVGVQVLAHVDVKALQSGAASSSLSGVLAAVFGGVLGLPAGGTEPPPPAQGGASGQ